MKWLVLFFTFVADALKIENVIFEEYSMYGATVTMVCEYKVGESEYVDSIKWYKDNSEFYRIVPHTSIEKDKVVTFNVSGIHLDRQRSGVSTSLLNQYFQKIYLMGLLVNLFLKLYNSRRETASSWSWKELCYLCAAKERERESESF